MIKSKILCNNFFRKIHKFLNVLKKKELKEKMTLLFVHSFEMTFHFLFEYATQVKSSIFVINTFLIENKSTTLIEYSVFFEYIHIFQYPRMNNVELEPSLWLYVYHSRNVELIHLIISYQINPPNDN